MIIIKNMLKKHDVNNFIFAQYYDNSKEVISFVVQINELDAYDLLNKKLISNFGYIFKKPLTDFVSINDYRISSIKAKKLAKPYLRKFAVFCEEEAQVSQEKYN